MTRVFSYFSLSMLERTSSLASHKGIEYKYIGVLLFACFKQMDLEDYVVLNLIHLYFVVINGILAVCFRFI